MYKLRPYQQKAVDSGLESLKKKKNEVLVLPTGAGKSLIVSNLAIEINKPILVLQPNAEILEQNFRKMQDYEYENIAIFSASLKTKEIARVTFATIGSIKNLVEKFKALDLGAIIVDEAHTVNGKGGMYKDFIKAIDVPVLGLTATPFRMVATQDMAGNLYVQAKFLHRTQQKIFTGIAHITQLKELFDDGFLHKPTYIESGNYDVSKLQLNSTGRDFTDESLQSYNAEVGLTDDAYTEVLAAQKNGSKHILVFNKFVFEAEDLSEKLRKVGVIAATVSSKTKPKERKQMLEDFKAGRIDVVTNVGVLTTGFDFPELDTIIMARPTMSLPLYYQIVGRVIRIHPEKKQALVIDLCGNVERFGGIETFEIVAGGKTGKLHRLKSDKGFLTGVNFADDNKDLETAGEIYGEKDYKKCDDILPFGKHKGLHIRKIPNGYVDWAAENMTSKGWQDKFKAEQKRRKENPSSKIDKIIEKVNQDAVEGNQLPF